MNSPIKVPPGFCGVHGPKTLTLMAVSQSTIVRFSLKHVKETKDQSTPGTIGTDPRRKDTGAIPTGLLDKNRAGEL